MNLILSIIKFGIFEAKFNDHNEKNYPISDEDINRVLSKEKVGEHLFFSYTMIETHTYEIMRSESGKIKKFRVVPTKFIKNFLFMVILMILVMFGLYHYKDEPDLNSIMIMSRGIIFITIFTFVVIPSCGWLYFQYCLRKLKVLFK